MPYFSKPQTVKIILPTSKDLPHDQQYWVEIKDKLEVQDMGEIDLSGGEFQGGIAKFAPVLVSMIISWNLTGEDGEVQAITTENVQRLEFQDFTALVSKVFKSKRLTIDETKKS